MWNQVPRRFTFQQLSLVQYRALVLVVTYGYRSIDIDINVNWYGAEVLFQLLDSDMFWTGFLVMNMVGVHAFLGQRRCIRYLAELAPKLALLLMCRNHMDHCFSKAIMSSIPSNQWLIPEPSIVPQIRKRRTTCIWVHVFTWLVSLVE